MIPGVKSVPWPPDSHAAITKILDPKVRPGGGAIRDLIYQNALTIRNNGHTLVLRWVPSHSKILGNEKADAVAKDAAILPMNAGHRG